MTKSRSNTRADRKQAALIQETSRLVHKAVIEGLVRVGLDSRSDLAPLLVERAAVASAPARMSAQSPEAAREQNRAMYERCLQTYRSVVRAQDAALTVDNVGAAVAFFVAVNLHTLHGVDATAEMLLPLERQLRGVAARSSEWATASIAERQFFFEQIAILSILIAGQWATARSQGPAAVANVQSAARGYLQQMLGLNPDLLTLAADGLTVREPEIRRAA